MRKYKYFVSFYQRVPDGGTISNSIITSSTKLDSIEDIYDIQKVIQKKLIEFGESEKTTVKLISMTLL